MKGYNSKELVRELANFAEFSANAIYVSRNIGRFIQLYPDRWIGVLQGRVVEVAGDRQSLMRKLKQKMDERDIDRIYKCFISREKEKFLVFDVVGA